jgi:predicted dinucleotide-binding enzyme
MAFKTFAHMNIAVIGEGNVAETITRTLALASHTVYIGTKNEHPLLSNDLLENYKNIFLATIEYAASIADIIIIATPADEVREAAYLLDDIRSKIIIDLSAYHLPRYGQYINTIGAIQAITFSPYVIKCYAEDGYDGLINLFGKDERGRMFFVGDSRKSKEMAKLILRDLGYNNYVDMGNSDDVDLLDDMAVNPYLPVKTKEYAVVRR